MKKAPQPKPHFHILEADELLVAIVVVWKLASRNVMMPYYFYISGKTEPVIGEWLRPICNRLFQSSKPLYLRDHHGHEFEVDKDESESSFFF